MKKLIKANLKIIMQFFSLFYQTGALRSLKTEAQTVITTRCPGYSGPNANSSFMKYRVSIIITWIFKANRSFQFLLINLIVVYAVFELHTKVGKLASMQIEAVAVY